MMKILNSFFSTFLLSVLLCTGTVKAADELPVEQLMLEALVKSTILAFENPAARDSLEQFSEFIKNEQLYQFIIQKIDKFILTNELDAYEEQAEALKQALTEMRELYLRSEDKAIRRYNDMKRQQQEREKQRQLKANGVIEV